jgi:hypothetical protein
MTSKEKAFDLIRLYRNIEFDNGENCYLMISMKNAKQCALIAVDEILNEFPQGFKGNFEERRKKYWQEVKKEIEAL